MRMLRDEPAVAARLAAERGVEIHEPVPVETSTYTR